jgi:hypothetical protein
MLLAAATFAAHVAFGQQEYNVELYYNASRLPTNTPAAGDILPWNSLNSAFDRDANSLFGDQFNSLRVMDWRIKLGSRAFEDFRDRRTRVARFTFTRSALFSVRDAMLDSPIVSWVEGRDGFLANVIRNSVDSTEEEAVAPLETSYGARERSWWRRVSESGNLHFGVRPFRTDPYAFASAAIRDGGNVLVVGNLRYHYNHFTDHNVELALSVPLPDGISIDLGAAYQLAGREDVQRLVLKFLKTFNNGMILHFGLEVRDRPGLVAGLAIPM